MCVDDWWIRMKAEDGCSIGFNDCKEANTAANAGSGASVCDEATAMTMMSSVAGRNLRSCKAGSCGCSVAIGQRDVRVECRQVGWFGIESRAGKRLDEAHMQRGRQVQRASNRGLAEAGCGRASRAEG